MTGPEKFGLTVEAKIPTTGYRRSMYFNRFRVERLDANLVIYFGLVTGSGGLADSYGCLMPKVMIDKQRVGLAEYLERLGGGPATPPPQWVPMSGVTGGLDVVDFITMSYGEQSEICLCNLPVTPHLLQRQKEPKERSGNVTVDAQPVALLRCAFDTQRSLIHELISQE